MQKITPMMEQYFSIKANHKDSILMFRLGDFYEIFFEDAKIAAKELDIALTGRDWGQTERAPMCGVPVHAVDGYIAKLVEKGFRVALADQIEDAKFAKGIVKRDVIRVITQGTITDAAYLDEKKHNYIAAIHSDKNNFSVAFADVSTGIFLATSFEKNEQLLLDEISKISPSEIILPENFSLTRTIENATGLRAVFAPTWTFHPANAQKLLAEHFGTMHLGGFGLSEGASEIPVAGALLQYLSATQKNSLAQITRLKTYSQKQFMVLDSSSRRNLELTASARSREKKGSLLWVLDRTKTAAGARLLRHWVDVPLIDTKKINLRLDAVCEWKNSPLERAELREYLHGVHDLERVMARLSTRYGTARDLAVLRASAEFLPAIERLLAHSKSDVNTEIRRTFDSLSDIREKISRTITDAPPATVREGGMIRGGVDATLDDLKHIKKNAQNVLAEMEAREKNETGISSLKIRFNRVFGYYIEITASNLSKVPDNYIRKQTLANCERFVTEELKNLEETLLNADEKIIAGEYEIFESLRAEIVGEMARVQFAASVLATLDVLQSLAEAAEQNSYVKPSVTNGTEILIREGRHPVVEKLTTHAFVPNDSQINEQNRLAIITGPNMAGKSTYMRQVALIVLMAQIGSFVPADSAEIGVVDRIFTRVGASDDLATGQSTFMVEMTEAANILNNASRESLVLLDEIGRGTSTFDGLAIAWAVLEHIAKNVRAKTLFATHYHEITQLEGRLDGVKNFCFTAQEIGDDIVFLRKLIHGEAGQSFGIHVARLAGLPQNVLAHAAELLENFNSRGAGRAPNFERAGRAPNFERAGRAPDFDEPSPKTKRRPENENKNSRAEKNKFADEISREEKNKFSDENIFADEISREGKNKNEEKNILADALREIEIEKITPLEAIVALARLKEML